ncbi:hypothetical protein [Stenotrophomonas phage RAS14]
MKISKVVLTNEEISVCAIITSSRLDRDVILSVCKEAFDSLSQEAKDVIHLILGYDERVVKKKLLKEYCIIRDYYLQWRDQLPGRD